ncbi:MAG: universal stress protein [Methylibium sp.]|nr:universal stress protein [Methylibium sp.]
MHTPKSILLHLDGSARTAERVQVAQHLAETFNAQVTGLYGAMPALQRYPLAVEGSAATVAKMADLDADGREAAKAAFVVASAGSPRLKWSESNSDAFRDFTRRAFYADLMILGQRNPDDPAAGELPADFVPSLLVDSGRPALVLPYAGAIAPIGRTALVAWKETREAARAMSAALPWLRRAEQVHVVCYDDEPAIALHSLEEYLTAQGVAATLHRAGPEQGSVGENLLSRAADLEADLLVMGCYGHSRAREWVLGGATRTVLRSMTVPVLMVH